MLNRNLKLITFRCRQNLDPPSRPLPFSVKKIVINLSYTQCVCYISPLLSQFSFLRFSFQFERRCSPPRHTFPCSYLVFPRGTRNFLAITYSDNFHKTCHFQVAWNPTSLSSAILVFLLVLCFGHLGSESRVGSQNIGWFPISFL